jgi:hypothetical protein
MMKFLMIALLSFHLSASAQDSTKGASPVTGGIYDRPYLFRPSSQLAIGGYAEAMFRSEYEEGIHENSSFEARRFNLFVHSAFAERIRMTAELEFEHGTEEIKLEMAIVDVELYDELNFRGGILLSPLGKFNIAHDSPRNEFNDRPLVSTLIIPSTLSEAGFGLFGSVFPGGDHMLTYEAYLVNGLTDGVVLAGDGTSIPDGRPVAFDEDNNGSPAAVGRVAFRPGFGGEIGLSGHTGAYNTFEVEGVEVDERRQLTIVAIDGEFRLGDLTVQGEFAHAKVEIPPSLVGLYAENQQGFYAQGVYTIFRGLTDMFPRSTLSAGVRFDQVNLDTDIKGALMRRVTVGLNLRLVPDTALKLDYQHSWNFDRLNNETRAAVVQFGLATYF